MKNIKCAVLLLVVSCFGVYEPVKAVTSAEIIQAIGAAAVPVLLFGCGYAGHILRQRYHKRDSDAEKKPTNGIYITINATAPDSVVIRSDSQNLESVQLPVQPPATSAAVLALPNDAVQQEVVAATNVQSVAPTTANVEMQEIKLHADDAAQPATLDANSTV